MALTISRLGERIAEKNPKGWFAGRITSLSGPERQEERIALSWRVLSGDEVVGIIETIDGRVLEFIPAPGVAETAVFVANLVREEADRAE